MRTFALVSLAAALVSAAPVTVRQLGGNLDGAQLANGPNAISDPLVNNGAFKEGSVDSSLSFDGAAIVNPFDNTIITDTTNVDVHDNNIINPDINVATGGNGPTAVGNHNFVLPVNAGGFNGIHLKRQVPGGSLDGAQLANGPNAISSPTVNNGALKEGSVDSNLSFDGAAIVNPVGNVLESDTTNINLHDNNFVNPNVNIATGGTGPTIVGAHNFVQPINSGGFNGIDFAGVGLDGVLYKRQQLSNAPSAINDPTLNQGVLTEGSTDSGVSFDGAYVPNAVGNSVTDVSDNTEIAGNEFIDPTFNSVSGNNGPSLAGDNNIFIPINNEGMIVNLDGNFAAQQAANQQAIIDRFTHHGFF